ncbi:5-oxoprolinase subunit PxpA [Mycolicibacterium sp. 050158]|uniref:5-oxoprolinase subunit PxpA n=1 Tax=Mycolicibacterium sp. 050158 TaxID=3090602 RepID=UPI00299DE127|nr:5-oxoprolinase subunit PxpA [Mycolicibacterium sp. 050158]MDX1888020.1 5-oxoprolinase subunit PxpA [Mycolicibacterium sp. 050158]
MHEAVTRPVLRRGINCDLGESYGRLRVGFDDEVMPFLSTANIACGYHGGDPSTMRRAAESALAHDVLCGAHPSLPDLQGFGRRRMDVSPTELTDMVVYQIGALQAILRAAGTSLSHVKAHGVLYSMTWEPDLAHAFADAIEVIDPGLPWIAMAGTPTFAIAQERGLNPVPEFTADRDYGPDGRLIITRSPGPVDIEQMSQRVRDVVSTGSTMASDGVTRLSFQTDVVCMHSDGPNAPEVAARLWSILTHDGHQPWSSSVGSN